VILFHPLPWGEGVGCEIVYYQSLSLWERVVKKNDHEQELG
jgi:hypothetical protein